MSLPDHRGDGEGGPIGLAVNWPRSIHVDRVVSGHVAGDNHPQSWPLDPACWRTLATCELCGLTMLKLFISSSDWVVRRVERVSFIDECTVRRKVSIDYVAPEDAVMFCRPNGEQVRILPLAIIRRKSLVNFDFRDHEGRALPLLGLRQNQALTLAVIRAWAAVTLQAGMSSADISEETCHFLDDVIAGDQIELRRAFKHMREAPEGSQLHHLGKDPYFRAVLDRLADSFVLYGLHDAPFGERQLVKFSYDEPLTLRYAKSSYRPISPGENEAQDEYKGTQLPKWHWRALAPAMGFYPTRIKFPVPAAELAGSFHFEISAPPEVSIINAVLLAGRPKPEPNPAAVTSAACPASRGKASTPIKDRQRRRPSFDAISGGYPTIDLHVADVPYGSRSQAQVEVEARVTGWFGTAVFSSWLASAVLLFASLARPQPGVGSGLLMSFAAGLAVLLVRQDPHRLVTMLLSKVRMLATVAAVLALAAAVVMASNNQDGAHDWLWALFAASLIPTSLVSASWLLALRRFLCHKPEESPWEHHWPGKSKLESEDFELPAQLKNKAQHEMLALQMEDEDYPYDWAHRQLGFFQPAIRVASCEGERQKHMWDNAFALEVHNRLQRHFKALTAATHDQAPSS